MSPQAHFEPYLARARRLLQRYVLLLDVGERLPTTPGAEGSAHDAAYRCLFDAPLPAQARAALEDIERDLGRPYEALAAQHEGAEARFEVVRVEFGLDEVACDALWVMLSASLSPPFLWLCRALWGDKDRSHFDLSFLGHVVDPQGARLAALHRALGPSGPLRAGRLVVNLQPSALAEDAGRWVPSRPLLRFLLGVEDEPPVGAGLVALHPVPSALEERALSPALLQRLRAGFAGKRRFALVAADGAGPLWLARQVLGARGLPLIEADLPQLLEGGEEALALLLGEARFRRAGVYLDKAEALAPPAGPRADLARRFLQALAAARVPLFLRASLGLSVQLRLRLVGELEAVELRLAPPDLAAREALWRAQLAGRMEPALVERVLPAARAYQLSAPEIEQALELARLQALQRDPRGHAPLLAPDLEAACAALAGQKLGALASRVRVLARWDDVVLPEAGRRVVDEMLRFGRHREQVFQAQGYGERMSYGKGLTALFWGPPGTGKTMVSGLIARELGVELYRVDLSQVLSKYIGETEQRLAQIFDEAQSGGVALLFDEADALFAKRTEVKSSTDRYSNLEVNYLLQRVEGYEGAIILTTNALASIDDAFMRRIRFKAEFPRPQAHERALLWGKMVPPEAPQDPHIRFDALGEVYDLSGGEIRNAILRAAFYAAEEGRPLGLDHLDRAAQVEYREGGRLLGVQTAARWAAQRPRGAG